MYDHFPDKYLSLSIFICDRNKAGCTLLHRHFDSSGIILYKAPGASLWSSFLPPSPFLLSPSCSSSSSLPCVCACFRAWQEAQIRGLKLDQIFSRYRFLGVPGFPTSSTQLHFHPFLRQSFPWFLHFCSPRCSHKVVCCTQTAQTDSHARMHMGNHKLIQSGR